MPCPVFWMLPLLSYLHDRTVRPNPHKKPPSRRGPPAVAVGPWGNWNESNTHQSNPQRPCPRRALCLHDSPFGVEPWPRRQGTLSPRRGVHIPASQSLASIRSTLLSADLISKTTAINSKPRKWPVLSIETAPQKTPPAERLGQLLRGDIRMLSRVRNRVPFLWERLHGQFSRESLLW
jgi:hypothetical protein